MALTIHSFRSFERPQVAESLQVNPTAYFAENFRAEALTAMDEADRAVVEILLRAWSQFQWSVLGGSSRRARLFRSRRPEHVLGSLMQNVEASWSKYFSSKDGLAVRAERAYNFDYDAFYYRWAVNHPDATKRFDYVREAVERYQERPEIKAQIEAQKSSN